MTRKEARDFMMKVCFQMESNGKFSVDQEKEYLDKEDLSGQTKYCKEIYSLICNKKEEIDEFIAKYSKEWSIKRMPKTDLAILRIATAEILYLDDIPDSVSINEAVEITKVYGEEESSSYVNAILGNIKKEKDQA